MKLQQLPTVLRHFFAAKWRERTLTSSSLATYQDKRARHMIAHARRHNPFYRNHWAQHAATNWRTLPTIDKAVVNANFSQLNCYGIDYTAAHCLAQAAEEEHCTRSPMRVRLPRQTRQRKEIIAGLSSGTSGERGLFLVTQREIAMWAGVILARALHKMPWRGCRVAFFLRAFSRLYAGVNSPLLQLRYFALTQPLAEVVALLNHFRPDILIGPPSLLERLAQARQRGLLRITPNRLIAVAEVLEPQDEANLHTIFDAPIHQIYQCTEGLLAVSCGHGSLHIQEDLVAMQLEPVDAPFVTSSSPTMSTRYTPIITDLWRRTQPIIRYRLGDLLQISDQPCPCGSAFRVISAIEGRMADIPHFTANRNPANNNTGTIRIPFFPAILRQLVLDSSPAISDYEIVQAHDDQLDIHLAVDSSSDFAPTDFASIAQRVEAKMTAYILDHGCQRPTVTIAQGIPPRSAIVKRRRVRREEH